MKKHYEQPIAEIILLQSEAIMTGEDGDMPIISGGDEGFEDW